MDLGKGLISVCLVIISLGRIISELSATDPISEELVEVHQNQINQPRIDLNDFPQDESLIPPADGLIRDYTDWSVFRFWPGNVIQLGALIEFQLITIRDAEHGRDQIDFWTEPYATERPVDVAVGPWYRSALESLAKDNDIYYEVLIFDLGQ